MTDENRKLAAAFFNAVWDLLDNPGRSADEDLQMVHLAHASRAHWQVAGGKREWAIGEWQIARVYAVLGRGEPALVHATVALALTADGALGPFLHGCAEEVMARACRVAGDKVGATQHEAAARTIAAALTDTEERDLLLADLDGER